jgi:multidrug efflux system outer membrane protein
MLRYARHAIIALVLAAVLAGCSLVPTYERPAAPVPAAWSAEPAAAAAAVPVTADWWRRFGSSELDQLMTEALAANQDIAASIARIEQARATTRIASAALLPTVEGSGSASADWRRSNGMWHDSDDDQALLTASYEIDLWGKNAAGVESAQAALAASIYDRDALALVLQADLATNYFTAVALKDRLTIARDNLEAAREVLRLVEIQLAQGAGTALDLAQQRSAVASFEAQVPLLQQQLQATESALAILLGRAPGGTGVQDERLASLALPAIAAGQPSDLLERRPDIRRAEADLIGANADIGAARAAFYPSVTLSASAALSGIATSGASTVASLAAGVVQPIFAGGRLEGELDRTKARRQELIAAYRQTILTSFKEVEDAMTGVARSAERAASLTQAAAEASEAFRLAQISYAAGASDFLTVLDAQRTLLDSQDSLVQAELDRYTNAANLFKALGGGWGAGA